MTDFERREMVRRAIRKNRPRIRSKYARVCKAVYVPEFTSTMGQEERGAIIDAVLAARKKGDEEMADKLIKKIPMPPEFAEIAKNAVGLRELRESGYNLSDAVVAFGGAWLDE